MPCVSLRDSEQRRRFNHVEVVSDYQLSGIAVWNYDIWKPSFGGGTREEAAGTKRRGRTQWSVALTTDSNTKSCVALQFVALR